MEYNIKIKQYNLLEKNENELYSGVINNLNEITYFEKGSDVKTSVFFKENYLEIVRYGSPRSILHISNQASFVRVISEMGNFEFPVKKILSNITKNYFECEYQIIDNNEILQHFRFEMSYKKNKGEV